MQELQRESFRIIVQWFSESDGMMVLQVREDGKTRVYDGNWATLDGTLRLDLGDGQVSSSGYEVLVNSLKIRFDGVSIDLGLRR